MRTRALAAVTCSRRSCRFESAEKKSSDCDEIWRSSVTSTMSRWWLSSSWCSKSTATTSRSNVAGSSSENDGAKYCSGTSFSVTDGSTALSLTTPGAAPAAAWL